MFSKILRIPRISILKDRTLTRCISWRKILTMILLFGGVMILSWTKDTFLSTLNNETMETEDSVSSVDSNKSEEFLNIEQRSTNDYCQINGCNIITCSSISKDADTGTIVSDFIESKFKASCKNTESVALLFDGCKFPANTLQRNWLRTNMSIDELTFNGCFLVEIEDEAFTLPIYESTRKIIMVNNKLVSLRKAMFRRLATLEVLTIQQNVIKLAEFNLLEHVADSLTVLELYQAIDDRSVLKNITGGNALPKLQILSIRGNSISIIDGELFKGVPAVQSLYLDNSNIEKVAEDTLIPMASSILQLILNDNDVTYLSKDLFTPVLNSKRSFYVAIQNNPWHCDCDLKWLQDLLKSQSNVVTSDAVCSTPEINAGKSFATADFCYETIPATGSSTSVKLDFDFVNETTTEVLQTSSGTVYDDCDYALNLITSTISGKLLPTDFYFRLHFPNFYISDIQHDSIFVMLPNFNKNTILLWFRNDNVEDSLSCAANVSRSYLIRNIDPQTAYTICLLEDNEDTVSLLNCLAVTTKSRYEFQTWLTNADKSLILPLFTFSLVLLFLLGSFLTFLLIRRYPTLLRGSKRIVIAKYRKVEAIVLPKVVDIERNRGRQRVILHEYSQEDGYVTPLPPERVLPVQRSRISVTNSQCDRHSYVSEIEPMETLLHWSPTNNEMEEDKLVVPPLPPLRPKDVIPSLSSVVDSMEQCHYQGSAV